jgi:hypothetical protein
MAATGASARQRAISTPDEPPAVIDDGDGICIALLVELREQIARLATGTVMHRVARSGHAGPPGKVVPSRSASAALLATGLQH